MTTTDDRQPDLDGDVLPPVAAGRPQPTRIHKVVWKMRPGQTVEEATLSDLLARIQAGRMLMYDENWLPGSDRLMTMYSSAEMPISDETMANVVADLKRLGYRVENRPRRQPSAIRRRQRPTVEPVVVEPDFGQSKTEAIVEDLTGRIEAGEFPPGSKLPAQQQLCKMYSVSPTIAHLIIDRLE